MKTARSWGRFKKNVSRRMASGMLVLVPVGVTLLVMRWLFTWAASLLRPVVKYATSGLERLHWIQGLPDVTVEFCVSVLAILLLLALLYFIGLLGQHIIGRRVIAAWEAVWLRIPLARSVYAATKQVVEALSQPEGAALKSVVLVEFPSPGLWAVGFLTGYTEDGAGCKYAKVLIPTTPNPTTGFLEFVPAEKITLTNLAVEEAFRMIISGGIVSPADLFSQKGEQTPADGSGQGR